jgi:hypothetical protein
MPVEFANFEYRYLNKKRKWVFVPTERCRKIAGDLTALVRERVDFDPHYYHFAAGAHVAALHGLRQYRYFGRLDLKNFFYSVGRNRVKTDLRGIGIISAERYARWSCVPNPYGAPRYSLPYGFPQSPLLATLALSRSALGSAVRDLPKGIMRSIYIDDIAIAADDLVALKESFEVLTTAAAAANLPLNEAKVSKPADRVDLFNCDLARGTSTVKDERIAEFYAKAHSRRAIEAFERYRTKVSSMHEDA